MPITTLTEGQRITMLEDQVRELQKQVLELLNQTKLLPKMEVKPENIVKTNFGLNPVKPNKS